MFSEIIIFDFLEKFLRRVDATKKTWKPSSEQNTVLAGSVASHQVSVKTPTAEGSAKATHSSSFKPPVHSSLHELSKACSTQLSKKGSPASLASKNTFSNEDINVEVKRNKNGHSTSDKNAILQVEKTVPACDDEKSRRQSDVNEPTRQPVAARMAAWKKKTAVSGEESMAASHRQLRTNGVEVTDERKRILAAHHQTAKANYKPAVGKQTNLLSTSDGQVLSCNDKSQTVQTSTSDVKSSPLKNVESRQVKIGLSPKNTEPVSTSSPKKLGPATLGIQQKLTAMCENWKKNEIAEKNRQERSTEMAILESRWKNGILAEQDVSSKQKVESKSASFEPPVASRQPVATVPQVC
jgi:hypothetical protein